MKEVKNRIIGSYIPAHILTSKVTFKVEGKLSLVYAAEGRKATLYINGSIKVNIHYGPAIEGDMYVPEKDMMLF